MFRDYEDRKIKPGKELSIEVIPSEEIYFPSIASFIWVLWQLVKSYLFASINYLSTRIASIQYLSTNF